MVLPADDFPGFRRVLEGADLVPFCRVLQVSDNAGLVLAVIVAKHQFGDLTLAPSRVNRKPHDVIHRDIGPAKVSFLEEVSQGVQLVMDWTENF